MLIETDDIRTLQGLEPQTTTDWTVSAIRMINGQPTTEYLSQIAATNAIGGLEPHADWNQLMSSSALDIQEEYSIMEGAITFYPGDTMTLVFENGTQRDPVPWRAFYISQGPTGPLATGGDFYNFFVLGLYPDSYDPNAPDPCNASAASSVSASTSASSSAAPVATATGWSDSAYPETADVVQPGLYPSGGGYLTGYFLKSISTAVLSIPTFSMSSDDAQNFSKTVAEFLSSSQKAGMTRVILDLQQNMGGDTMLAFDTFRQVDSYASISRV